MSLKSHFCVKCGSETDLTLQGLCANCYLKEYPISLAKQANLKVCPKCNSIQWQGVWIKPQYDVDYYIISYLTSKFKAPDSVKLVKIDINQPKNLVDVTVTVLGQEIKIEKEVNLKIDKFACPDCSRQFGNNWLAKIQVRTDVEPDELRDRVLKYSQEYADKVLKVEEQLRGVDIYFFDKPSANNLAKFLKEKLELKQLVTRENIKRVKGKEVWKDVILLKR